MERQSIVSRYIVLATLDLLAKVAGFGVVIFVARRFGEGGLGSVVLAQTITTQGLVVATFGMDLMAIQNVASRRRRVGSVASTLLYFRLLTALPVLALAVGLAHVVPQFQPARDLVFLFGITLLTGAVSFAWVPQALHQTHVFGIATFATQASYLALVMLGSHLSPGIWTVPIALVASELLVAGGLFLWFRKTVGRIEPPLPRAEAIGFLREGTPIGWSQVLRGLALSSDALFIGIFASMEDVGLYGAAYKFFLLGMGVVAAYFVILLPHFSREASISSAGMKKELRRALLLSMPVAAACFVIGFPLTGFVLRLCYGEPFDQAAGVLRILLAAWVVNLGHGHFRQALIALGEQRRNLRNIKVSTTVHIAVKLILIPGLGMTGAALGTLAGEAVLFGLGWMTTKAILTDDPPKNPDAQL